MYYPYSENKGADQLSSYCEADLRLCFRICRLLVFPCGSSLIVVHPNNICSTVYHCKYYFSHSQFINNSSSQQHLFSYVIFLEITSLVTDMHSSADKIIELFSTTPGADDMSTRADRSLAHNPAKLCYVVKQAIREAAIGKSLSYSMVAKDSHIFQQKMTAYLLLKLINC